jgi:hypothetical protein
MSNEISNYQQDLTNVNGMLRDPQAACIAIGSRPAALRKRSVLRS